MRAVRRASIGRRKIHVDLPEEIHRKLRVARRRFNADFQRLVDVIGALSRGVALNLGSTVIMPEVFLKALNLCRNLGRRARSFTTADMDFVRHYRPRVNVVERPTDGGGRGIMLTGHHEIMFPLLVAAVR